MCRFDDDKLLVRHEPATAIPDRERTDPPVFDASLMTSPSASACRSGQRRLVRAAARALVVTSLITGAGLAVGTGASAQQAELPVNALAPQITTEAQRAVNAYDDYVESNDLGDYLAYAAHRTATARLAARQLGYNEFEMIEAWKSTALDHQRAVLAAMTQLGVPYRRNASREGVGFDCSGLTLFAWRSSGVELDRVSSDQISGATEVDRVDAKAGDLVYYPGHVMMYLGVDNAVVHSLNTRRTVEVDTISARQAARVRFGDPAP